jgi:hypothetical protein
MKAEKITEMSANKPAISRYLGAALIPATVVGAYFPALSAVPEATRYVIGSKGFPLQVLFVYGLPCAVGAAAAFLINLLIPVAVNKRNALLVALPSFAILFALLVMRPILMPPDGYRSSDFGDPRMWDFAFALCLSLPLCLLGLAPIVYFGWLGTKVRTRFVREGPRTDIPGQ